MTNDSGEPFNFDDAFKTPPGDMAASTVPVEAAPPQLPSSYSAAPTSQSGQKRRGQSLSWVSLGLAVVGALAIGSGLYLALASVELSASPFETASDWMTL